MGNFIKCLKTFDPPIKIILEKKNGNNKDYKVARRAIKVYDPCGGL